jgi:Acyl-CoA thioesterase C-terminal domain/Acyl-CoA thioesterase N-terminal domain
MLPLRGGMRDTRAMSTPEHPLDAATHLEPLAAGLYRGRTSANYANMVGPFGGVIAATLLNAVLQHPGRQGDPIALTVNFAGPLADGAFTVEANPVRTNRSTQHWLVVMRQKEQAAATASAVFASRRKTWSALEARFPVVPAAHELPVEPNLERALWTRSYEMRFVDGAVRLPSLSREGSDSRSTLWIRDAPPRPLDFVSLAALCDAFFPRLFVRRPVWAPVGTVSFTTYFHADAALLAANGEAPVLGTAHAQQFRNGYFDQTAEVWSEKAALLATSHQIVYYKE